MKKLHYNTVSKTLIKCLKELMKDTPVPRKPNASAGDFVYITTSINLHLANFEGIPLP